MDFHTKELAAYILLILCVIGFLGFIIWTNTNRQVWTAKCSVLCPSDYRDIIDSNGETCFCFNRHDVKMEQEQ